MMRSQSLDSGTIEKAVLRTSEVLDRRFKLEGMWSAYNEDELWFELVACILSSRVRFEVARLHASLLRRAGLLSAREIASSPAGAVSAISSHLALRYRAMRDGSYVPGYPFYAVRAQWLVESAINLYGSGEGGITRMLKRASAPEEARDELVECCFGVGLKEASLFLRNILYTSELAILDVHVLRYMELIGISDGFNGRSPSHRVYLLLESSFKDYAREVRRSVASLDLAVWLVMRLATERGRA